ncbi:MAG: M48 family metalloprotease [Bdellovibrionia bacterium]
MQDGLSFKRASLFWFGIFFISACASSVSPPEVSPEERLRRDPGFNSQLSDQLERRLKIKKDPVVSIFLRKVAVQLAESSSEFNGAPLGVWLFQDEKGKFSSYSLPGNRIYLSVDLLRNLRFENEVAAVLGIQLGHLLQRDLLLRYLKGSQLKSQARLTSSLSVFPEDLGATSFDYWGFNGLFAFDEEAYLSAAKISVSLLYQAGYDPRGILSLFKIFQNNSKQSPYELSTISKMIEQVRFEIAKQPPLLSPIVRSQAFVEIQRRMQNL